MTINLKAFPIDLVHIHHTIDLSFDIFKEVKKRQIPLFVTIHDYYYICPTVKLLDGQLNFCKEARKEAQCNQCLKENFG